MNEAQKNRFKLDDNETFFFQRELEKVKTQTYDVKYPQFKARELFPTPDLDGDHGATSITYTQYDEVGMAKIVANYATDFPRVSLKGKQFTAPVKELGDSFGYSVKDIKSAQRVGKNLNSRLAMAARKAMFQKEEAIAYFGDSENGLPGFFSNASIPNAAVANDGSGSTTTWSTKTEEQIIRDVNEAINAIKTTTKGVEMANTVIMPTSAMAFLKNKPFGTFGMTMLSFLKENNPEITLWADLPELETAGTGSTRLLAAYNRDATNVSLEIPMDFLTLPEALEGAEYKIACMESICGVLVYYPLSANFVYGF